MAKKKQTPEELIVSFFTDSPLAAAQTLFNVANGIVKGRVAKEGNAPAAKPRATRSASKGTTTVAPISTESTTEAAAA